MPHQFSNRGNRGLQLEPLGNPKGPDQPRGPFAPKQLHQVFHMGPGDPIGCFAEDSAGPLVLDQRQMPEQRFQGRDPKLLQQLRHVVVLGDPDCFVDRLEHLSQEARLRKPGFERVELGPNARVDRGRSASDQPHLPEQPGHRSKLAPVEEVREHRLDQPDDLLTDGGTRLELEDVENRGESGGSNVGLVLVVDLALERVDLVFVEEIEGRVELVEVDATRHDGAELIADLLLGLGLLEGIRAGPHVDRLGIENREGVGDDLGEPVVDQGEIVLPQQRQQVVTGIHRQELGSDHRLEEYRQLVLLAAGPQGEHPQPILVQQPGEAFRLGRLVVDDVVVPVEIGLDHLEYQLRHVGPNGEERASEPFDGALVDRVVREVHLKRPDRLGDDTDQFFDLLRRKRCVRWRTGHAGQSVPPGPLVSTADGSR